MSRGSGVLIALLLVCVSCTSEAVVQESASPTTEDRSGDSPGGTIARQEDPTHPWSDESTLHFTLPSEPVEMVDGTFTVTGTGCGMLDPTIVVTVEIYGANNNEAGLGRTSESVDGAWSVDVFVSNDGVFFPDWEGPGPYELTVQCREQGVSYYETLDITIIE